MTRLSKAVWIAAGVVFLFPLVVIAWRHPTETSGFVLLVLLLGWSGKILARHSETRFMQMMRERKGENICTFRRAFNLREIDPWIVRAVYEEIRGMMGAEEDYPIRATDRLGEDLLIDPDDLSDAGEEIARRAGYSLTNLEQNPYWSRLNTVGDLVHFFAHQPCVRH